MSSSAGAVAGGVAGAIAIKKMKEDCLANMASHVNCENILNPQFSLLGTLLTILIILGAISVMVLAFWMGSRKRVKLLKPTLSTGRQE